MDTVTDEMREEVIQMLQLFGIPYVEAPAEAEAQAAVSTLVLKILKNVISNRHSLSLVICESSKTFESLK
jgi:ribose 5-phosphate isomerase RpiB